MRTYRTIMVFLNGVLQTPTVDYTLVESAAAVPDFVRPMKDGDVLAMHDFFDHSTRCFMNVSYWTWKKKLWLNSENHWDSVL